MIRTSNPAQPFLLVTYKQRLVGVGVETSNGQPSKNVGDYVTESTSVKKCIAYQMCINYHKLAFLFILTMH